MLHRVANTGVRFTIVVHQVGTSGAVFALTEVNPTAPVAHGVTIVGNDNVEHGHVVSSKLSIECSWRDQHFRS